MNKETSLDITEYMGINTPALQNLIYDILGEKRYSVKSITSSHKNPSQKYRTINHWSKKGLISQHQDGSGKWHKFTFIDLVELLIYEELRKIGFPLAKLLKVKPYLSEDSGFFVTVLNKKIQLSLLGHKTLQVILGAQLFITINQAVSLVEFSALSSLVDQLQSSSRAYDMLYQENNAVIIIDLARILDGLGIVCEQNNDKYKQLTKELFDEPVDKEIIIRQNKLGELGKIETTHIKDLDKEQNIKELIDTPGQTTTFHANQDGARQVKIKKELK
jgi:DNA-binding transcriptional MerR regulator